MSLLDHDDILAARDIRVHNYLRIFAVSCLFYDHAITLGQEVDYIWKRRKSRSSYWFFANRYLAFAGNIVVTIVESSTLSIQVSHNSVCIQNELINLRLSIPSCKKYNIFRQALLIGNQVVVCILLTLRIYALYGCSLRILAYLALSGGFLLVGSLWVLFGQKSAHSERSSGCHVALSSGTATRLAGAWEALFIYDSIIFFLTILKTWKARRDDNITGINIPLISLMLRDGAMYFAIMALCNLANILTFYFVDPFMKGSLSAFASCISVTMMSRLTLNLHRTADKGLLSTNANNSDAHHELHTWTDRLDFASPEPMAYDMEQNLRPHSRSRRYSRPLHDNDTPL